MSRRAGGPRILGLLLAVLLGLGGLVLGAAPAYACSCANQPNDPELAERADVVFTGTVAEDRTVGDTRYLTFVVDRVHKGDVAARQRLTTHAEGATCGLELGHGVGPYLVQGRGTTADLQADLCGGTRSMDSVSGLGEGAPPRPGTAGPSGPTPEGLPEIYVQTTDPTIEGLLVVAGVLAFGTAAVVLLVRRRRSAGPEG